MMKLFDSLLLGIMCIPWNWIRMLVVKAYGNFLRYSIEK